MRRGLSVSAVADVGVAVAVHEAGIPLEMEAVFTADVEIVIYGAFDAATEELIENARKAAKILREEYGIEALVVPNTVYWDVSHVGVFTPYSIPVLVINGREIAEGRVLKVEEIVDVALSLLGYNSDRSSGLPILKSRDDTVNAVASAW